MDEVIRNALNGIAVVVPGFQYGCEEISIAYQYNTRCEFYADDSPGAEIYLVLVHLNAPVGESLSKKIRQIKRALYRAGFTYPACINASDTDMQHYVFECEYICGLEEDTL